MNKRIFFCDFCARKKYHRLVYESAFKDGSKIKHYECPKCERLIIIWNKAKKIK